ncbi:MAG: aminotransferase class IV [Pseudomonadales bacterium]|nr:aminotransferase class IV [Pseudomonadales bacterium]
MPGDDRGLAYGDGVFRTLRVVGGRPGLLDRQLRKLLADACALGMEPPGDLARTLRREIVGIVAEQQGILRVTLTRGSGPRGYASPATPRLRRVLAFTPLPPPGLDARPVRLQVARTPLAVSPVLAGVKHLGRLEQVLAASEPAAAGVFDRLMCDPGGRPICGTRCNLFLRRGRRLCTPALDGSGVAGVVRELLLECAMARAPEVIDECIVARLTLEELAAADELLVTNSVFGVRAVAECLDVDGAPLFRTAAPGPLARQLLATLAAEFPAPEPAP